MAQSNAFKFANNILTNGGYDAADLVGAAGGKVLQVVSTPKTNTFASNPSDTFIDVTGLSVSITPSSASNKILVMINISGCGVIATNIAHFRLVRGATTIYSGDSPGSRQGAFASSINSDNNVAESVGGIFLDSPSTTSATTYKIQVYSNSTVYINRSENDNNDGNRSRTASSITVMEIAP
jgi:hypothetical protein